jgi:FG-GAP-like repeat
VNRTLFSLALTFLLSVTPFVSAQVNFNQQAIDSGDSSSSGIASGDFDNDGILDLITINGSTLSFYKGLGGGNFANPLNQAITPSLGQAMAADFNRDGKLDLAVVPGRGASGGLNILLGNGDGTFRPGTYIDLPGTQHFLTLADFNGDHLPDIAVSDGQGAQVYLGKGDGTFSLSSSLSYGGWQIVSGDFNADGHQDIIASTLGGQVALYLGKGDGTFAPGVLQTVSDLQWMAVGDFYNDRVQSLVVLAGNYDPPNFSEWLVPVRYTNGQLVVGPQTILAESIGDPYQEIAAGDLDGDFKDDAYIVGGGFNTGAISVYTLGNGDGTFQGPYQGLYWGDLQNDVLVRDLDGDSRHDVAIPYTWIMQQGSGLDALINTSAATNCTLPKGPFTSIRRLAINICAPANKQVVGQTFTFKGAGSAFNGIAKRMELWIDGKKVAQNLEDQLNATVSLSRGNHVAAFVVVNTFDEYYSRSVNFTVQY